MMTAQTTVQPQRAPKPIGFFTPYQSWGDAALYASLPVLSPIYYSAMACKDVLSAVFHLVNGVCHAVTLDGESALSNFKSSAGYCGSFLLNVLEACFSPIITFVMALTRAGASCFKKSEVEVTESIAPMCAEPTVPMCAEPPAPMCV